MYTTCGKLSAFGNTPRHLCFMRPAFVTWFYITSDIVTIVVQAIGIGIWASSRSGDVIDQEQAVRKLSWPFGKIALSKMHPLLITRRSDLFAF